MIFEFSRHRRGTACVVAMLLASAAMAQESAPQEITPEKPATSEEGERTTTVDLDPSAPAVEAADAAADVAAAKTGETAADAAPSLPTGQGDEGASLDLLTPPDFEASATAPSAPPPEPSRNVVINLINRLVERGLLSKEDAADLIAQAEADAEIARAKDEAATQAISDANAAAQELISRTPPPPNPDAVRVTYVPNIVKSQIKEEIKEDVLAEARETIFKDPTFVPQWLTHIKPFADFRFRYEGIFFPDGNDDTGVFPDFNAINTGAPFDVTGDEFSPQWNVSENRTRFRIRVRLGAELDLGDNFTAGVRLATGDSNNPVSPNQTLGTPNGNFNKYAIWLDRAFLNYELRKDVDQAIGISVGRFDNPFFRVSQIMWDDDLGFDGVAVAGRYNLGGGFTPFIAGGAFPIFNTSLNFPSNSPQKYESYDKYLFAVQGGLDWDVTKHINVTTALGYYYFQNIEGKLSDPFVPLDSNDAGNTDNSRPLFAQKGNTYRPIRNIIPTEANDFGTINQFQYYGLATKFQDLAFAGRISVDYFEPVVISVGGEFVKNLAFNDGEINAIAVNNRGDVNPDDIDDVGDFLGGDTAWIVDAEIGTPALVRRWDWKLEFGYRYVESDAVVDGFNDSDFGGGGTNLKGWTASGSLSLSPNVWLTARYLSGRSIAGPQFKEDIFQLDLNARF